MRRFLRPRRDASCPALKTRDIARAIGPFGLVRNSGKPDGTRTRREIKQKNRKNTANGSLSGGAISRRLSKRTDHPIFVSIARVHDKLISRCARVSHALTDVWR